MRIIIIKKAVALKYGKTAKLRRYLQTVESNKILREIKV